MNHGIDHGQVRSRLNGRVPMGKICQPDFAGIDHIQLSSTVQRFKDSSTDQRMLFRGVGANHQDQIGIRNVIHWIGGTTGAKRCRKTFYCGAVSETGTMVDAARL
ncbi:hypothetical protein DSECCO2_310100 [anaerobic digester metagenome]